MNGPIQNQPGVFVPMQVLGHTALNPALVYTWMKIKLLVGGQEESAPIGIQELVEYIGRSASTLYDHRAVLRRIELVRQRCEGPGQLIFSFPRNDHSEKPESTPEIRKVTPTSVRKTGIHSEKLENGAELDSGNLESTPDNWKTTPASVRKTGVNSDKLEPSPEKWNPALSLKPLDSTLKCNRLFIEYLKR